MKLIMFVAAEKTLVDKAGVVSLISILTAVKVGPIPPNPDVTLPRDAVVSKEWSLNAMWHVPTEQIGESFLQVFQISWPDGREFAQQAVPFQPTGTIATIYAQINAMPVGLTGSLGVRAWVTDTEGKVLTDKADYWIDIQY